MRTVRCFTIRKKLPRLSLGLVFSCICALAGQKPALEPFHLHDDFRTNTLSQWASYPPAQDVGYDPSLTPTNEYSAVGGRSLMRVVRPVSSSRLRFGFIKRLAAVANGEVSVSFSYRFTVGERPVVEVGLAGGNGNVYRKHFGAIAGGWAQSRLQFRDIPASTNINAIYITATFAQADPDLEYRFLLDEVSVQAVQPVQFEFEVPRATVIPPWQSFVSSLTYVAGQTLAIRVRAPSKLTKAECVLKNADNRTIAVAWLRADKGGWVNKSAYTFKESDEPGVWRAELHGVVSDGSELRSDLRMLVRSPRSRAHPRLYFDANGRSALLTRSYTADFAPVWRRLTALATSSRKTENIVDGTKIFSLLDPRYLLPTLPGYFDLLTKGSDRILYNSLTGYVADNREVLQVARSALLAIAGWQTWTPPWFAAHGQSTYYPVGELTTVVAFAYDILYNELSPYERESISCALLKHGVKASYDEYVLDNRVMANTSNWIGHTVGGAIVGATALLGEKDDPELNTYLGGLLMKFEDHLAASYLADGSYGEGISYQEFDLKTTTLALTALKRVCGIDYWKRTRVKDSLWYPLYTMATPIENTLDTGDTHPPTGYSVTQVVDHSSAPAMSWYYDQFKHSSINDFLFPPAVTPSKPPAALVSRIFEQKGNAVFRTGWSPDDVVLLFRAGPNFNHNHADQGSFLLRAMGETFVSEAGYSDYYKDPYYASYFSQAAGHNTVLVNADAASQEIADTPQFPALHSFPRITDSITSSFYDAVGSELASVYKDRLQRYTRRLVFLKPQCLVSYDDLAPNGGTVAYDWLLHLDDRERIDQNSSGFLYRAQKAAMGIRVLEPEAHKIEVRNGHLPFAVLNPAAPAVVPPQPAILDVKSEPNSGHTRFLVLFNWARSAQDVSASVSHAISITGSGCSGVRIPEGDVYFRHDDSRSARCGNWQTDASAWTSAGSVLAAEQVTILAKAGKTMLRSDGLVNFAANYGKSSVELITSADKPVTVRLYTGFQPKQFPQNQYDSASGTVTVRSPAGRAEFTLNR